MSGPLKGVSVETQVFVDGEETDCERDDIEAAVEKACGFAGLHLCELQCPCPARCLAHPVRDAGAAEQAHYPY